MKFASLVSLGLGILLTAGCVGTAPPGGKDAPPGTLGPKPIFVALVDSGVNPYHAAFADPSGTTNATLSAWTHVPIVDVPLSRDPDYGAALKADAAFWSAAKPGVLYHFLGTRVLATTTVAEVSPILLDTLDHGTGTASIVARDAPSAWIVMVQGQGTLCLTQPSCGLDPSFAAGMAWAAKQPWIDVVSLSIGLPGNAPDSGTLHPEARQFIEATRAAAASGKLVVAGAGNEPSPTLQSYVAGPPWVIAVGGYEPANRGASAASGQGVDVIANYSARIASGGSRTAYNWSSGTSFSAPEVAATLADVLQLLAQAPPKANASQPALANAIREAMNQTATRVQPGDFDPTGAPMGDPVNGRLLSPSTPALLGTQQGWGLLGPNLATAIRDHVQGGAGGAGTSDPTSTQAQWQQAREDYWANAEGAR